MPQKVLSLCENIVLCAEEHSEEWRKAAIAAASVSCELGQLLANQVNHGFSTTTSGSVFVEDSKGVVCAV